MNYLGLYIHVPFCRSKCRYCDFNSFSNRDNTIPTYFSSLGREALLWAKYLTNARIQTIYFGGGTPSFAGAINIASILTIVKSTLNIADVKEITIEANPDSVDSNMVTRLIEININRLSLGIQSFDNDLLAMLGRPHNSEKAIEAFRSARTAGFRNISIDLLYGLPNQTLEQWESTIETSIGLAPEHISLYALTLDPNTGMARDITGGLLPYPDPDLAADMYMVAQEALSAASYENYEISNWALPGYECQHNMNYWNNGDYIGLGAGAHSHYQENRFSNIKDPDDYINSLRCKSRKLPDSLLAELPRVREWREMLEKGWQVMTFEAMDKETRLADRIILGLRQARGINLIALLNENDTGLDSRYTEAVKMLSEIGLIEGTSDSLRLSLRGRLLSNEVFQYFLRPDKAAPVR